MAVAIAVETTAAIVAVAEDAWEMTCRPETAADHQHVVGEIVVTAGTGDQKGLVRETFAAADGMAWRGDAAAKTVC